MAMIIPKKQEPKKYYPSTAAKKAAAPTQPKTNPKRNVDGSPMLDYPSMRGGVARNNPASITKEKFTKEQLTQAKKLFNMFAGESEKGWIKGSKFSSDPIIIQAILDFDRTLKKNMDDMGMTSMTDDPKMAHRLVQDLRGTFSGMMMNAQSEWIRQNGPISNYEHPGDSYERDLRRAEGLDENTGRPITEGRKELVSTIKEAMSDD